VIAGAPSRRSSSAGPVVEYVPGMVDVRWFTGPRSELRDLFALAEDSEAQLAKHLDQGRVLVAVDGDAIVGHLQLGDRDADDAVEILTVAVAEDRQRRGIGRMLVQRALDEAHAMGTRTVLVATATADVGNLRFYQRLGFRMLRVERDAFTTAQGYPDGIVIDGIPLRDRVWLSAPG
jgi:predicted N-acetyltransferase YhbS